MERRWGLHETFRRCRGNVRSNGMADPRFQKLYYSSVEPFSPTFALPSKLLDIDPAYSACQYASLGLFDPPKALTPAAVMDPATTRADPMVKPTPASPQSPPKGLPTNTAALTTVPAAANNGFAADPPKASNPRPKASSNDHLQHSQSSSASDLKSALDPKAPMGTTYANPQSLQNQNQPGQNQQGQNLPGNNQPGQTQPDPNTAAAAPASASKASNIVPGQSIPENAATATLGSTAVAYSSGFIIVGTNAAPIADPAAAVALITVGAQTADINLSGVVIGGHTVVSGAAPVTIQGTAMSLGSGGLIMGASTFAIAQQSPSGHTGATVAGQVISVGPSGIVIGSITLTPGGAPTMVSGTPVSAISAGGSLGLVIDKSTLPVPVPDPAHSSVFTFSGETLANPAALSIAGTTLFQGGPAITISGTPMSLGTGVIAMGSSTMQLSLEPSKLPSPSIYTVGGQTFTADPTGFPIAGTTLSPGGPAVTVFNTVVSLDPSGRVVMVPSTTMTWPNGLGSSSSSFSSSATGFAFTGSAVQVVMSKVVLLITSIGMAFCVMVGAWTL